jgi:curved DNA-binding protein CbpA
MPRALSDFDYYALLGVARDASADDIKAGFREFARHFHPDRYAGDAERAAKATRVYQRATEAYRVLTSLEQRRLYDEQLGRGQLRLDPEVARRTSGRPSGVPGSPEGYAPRARPFVARAEQALRSKDYQQAKLNFQIALQHDSANEGLRRRLGDVDALLKSR